MKPTCGGVGVFLFCNVRVLLSCIIKIKEFLTYSGSQFKHKNWLM